MTFNYQNSCTWNRPLWKLTIIGSWVGRWAKFDPQYQMSSNVTKYHHMSWNVTMLNWKIFNDFLWIIQDVAFYRHMISWSAINGNQWPWTNSVRDSHFLWRDFAQLWPKFACNANTLVMSMSNMNLHTCCAEPLWFSISPDAFGRMVFPFPILGQFGREKLSCHLL